MQGLGQAACPPQSCTAQHGQAGRPCRHSEAEFSLSAQVASCANSMRLAVFCKGSWAAPGRAQLAPLQVCLLLFGPPAQASRLAAGGSHESRPYCKASARLCRQPSSELHSPAWAGWASPFRCTKAEFGMSAEVAYCMCLAVFCKGNWAAPGRAQLPSLAPG